MKLTTEQLLAKGYFCKELPPPFTTELFGKKYKKIEKKITQSVLGKLPHYSECVCYSIPKNGFSRRRLSIPNPLHYELLCQSIVDNWTKIERIYKSSPYSTSRPTFNDARLSNHGTQRFEDFKRNRLMMSGENIFELKTDISRYYATIYTHIIPWVIYRRAAAKANRFKKELWGNVLDANIRNLQSAQTIGIPIGPEASAIIAELIGCRIDKILQSKLGRIKGFRYIDDYYFYFPQESTGEKIIKFLQVVLGEYQLELNDQKTRITKFPFGLESEWVLALRSFVFRETGKEQENDIRDYFSMVFRYAIQFPNDPVLKYAIRKIEAIEFDAENWKYLETWILKATLHNPLILEDVTRIFLSNLKKISKLKVKGTVQAILRAHTSKKNSYEIAWALWLAKSLAIKIDAKLIQNVFSSGDVISILVALDLKNSHLIQGNVNVNKLNSELTEDSLFDDRWLLTYEALVKKWLNPHGSSNLLSKNLYFRILLQEKVSFYDPAKQVVLYKKLSKKEKELKKEPLKINVFDILY
jgi:hypothetical protein